MLATVVLKHVLYVRVLTLIRQNRRASSRAAQHIRADSPARGATARELSALLQRCLDAGTTYPSYVKTVYVNTVVNRSLSSREW